MNIDADIQHKWPKVPVYGTLGGGGGRGEGGGPKHEPIASLDVS